MNICDYIEMWENVTFLALEPGNEDIYTLLASFPGS